MQTQPNTKRGGGVQPKPNMTRKGRSTRQGGGGRGVWPNRTRRRRRVPSGAEPHGSAPCFSSFLLVLSPHNEAKGVSPPLGTFKIYYLIFECFRRRNENLPKKEGGAAPIHPFPPPLRHRKGWNMHIYSIATQIHIYFYEKYHPTSPTTRMIPKCCD